MSDRDGCWDSDWDPETGIEPLDDRDVDDDRLAEEAEAECIKWMNRYRYEVHSVGTNGSEYVVMRFGEWRPLYCNQNGKFQTELKWLADIVAEKFKGCVVEAEKELTEEELWDMKENLEQ